MDGRPQCRRCDIGMPGSSSLSNVRRHVGLGPAPTAGGIEEAVRSRWDGPGRKHLGVGIGMA